MLSKAAELHRKMFLKMLAGVGKKIKVFPPPPRTTSSDAASKVFGAAPSESSSEYGEPVEVLAVVSDVLAGATNFGPEDSFPVGILHESDLVIRVYLPDVLVDSSAPRGLTILDTAKAIEVDGQLYERIGKIPKTGLPPIGPYIAWAGLKRLG
jgi:hypothetical protein